MSESTATTTRFRPLPDATFGAKRDASKRTGLSQSVLSRIWKHQMASTDQAARILDDEQLGRDVTFEQLTGVLLREGLRISDDLVVARAPTAVKQPERDTRTADLPLAGRAP